MNFDEIEPGDKTVSPTLGYRQPGQDGQLWWAARVVNEHLDGRLVWDEEQVKSANAEVQARGLDISQVNAVLSKQAALGQLEVYGKSASRPKVGGWNVDDFLSGLMDDMYELDGGKAMGIKPGGKRPGKMVSPGPDKLPVNWGPGNLSDQIDKIAAPIVRRASR